MESSCGPPVRAQTPSPPTAPTAHTPTQHGPYCLHSLLYDVGHATGWRIWAWAKLVKVWASLRIIPAELSLVEGRLTTVLRRNQNFGPSRRVKELPVAISEHASSSGAPG